MLIPRLFNRNLLRKTVCKRIINPNILGAHKECVSTDVKTVRKEFLPIYYFPYSLHLAVINKLKFYQTSLAGIAIPGSLILSGLGLVSSDVALTTIAIGVPGIIVLHSIGWLIDNWVGVVYIHKDFDRIKISYIGKWGNRQEVIVETNDIVPFSDSGRSLTDILYYKLSRYSVKDTLKLNIKQGKILDETNFNRIFKLVIKKI